MSEVPERAGLPLSSPQRDRDSKKLVGLVSTSMPRLRASIPGAGEERPGGKRRDQGLEARSGQAPAAAGVARNPDRRNLSGSFPSVSLLPGATRDVR